MSLREIRIERERSLLIRFETKMPGNQRAKLAWLISDRQAQTIGPVLQPFQSRKNPFDQRGVFCLIFLSAPDSIGSPSRKSGGTTMGMTLETSGAMPMGSVPRIHQIIN